MNNKNFNSKISKLYLLTEECYEKFKNIIEKENLNKNEMKEEENLNINGITQELLKRLKSERENVSKLHSSLSPIQGENKKIEFIPQKSTNNSSHQTDNIPTKNFSTQTETRIDPHKSALKNDNKKQPIINNNYEFPKEADLNLSIDGDEEEFFENLRQSGIDRDHINDYLYQGFEDPNKSYVSLTKKDSPEDMTLVDKPKRARLLREKIPKRDLQKFRQKPRAEPTSFKTAWETYEIARSKH